MNAYLFRRVIGFGSLLGLLLVFAPVGLADRDDRPGDEPSITGGLRAYTPPSNARRPEGDHTGGSVRGCGDDVVAIAPRLSAVGQTASTNTTFVWYNFSEDNDPIEFQLYRYEPEGGLSQVLVKQFDESQEGYMAYTLPAEEAELSMGETYVWQVVLYCDADFEDPGNYSSAELEVVDLPEEATDLPSDALARAKIYADAGLWYDALAEVYSSSMPDAEAFRQDLLLDIADLDEQADKNRAEDISEQFRAIARRGGSASGVAR